MKKILKNILSVTDKILNKIFLANYFFTKYFLDIINLGINDCSTVLEIGAGKNSYLKLIGKPLKITAIDIHKESLSIGLKKKVFDEIIVGNVLLMDQIIHPDSFDAVVAFDFIEHLEKEEGHVFLEKCEKIAKKAVIIFTPNGFLEQPASNDNPFQEHKSGWTFNEMKEFNYMVFGVNGAKCLSGKYNIPMIKPISFGNLLRNISSIILRIFKLERYSACILCIKRIKRF